MVEWHGQTDPEGAVEPQLNPGDCLIFENRAYHAGAANLSSWTRKGIMIGYGYRWVMPMDFRKQDAAFVEKLDPLQRCLVGEAYEAVDSFQPDGGANPLKEWCDTHGVTPFRHLTAEGGYVAYGRR